MATSLTLRGQDVTRYPSRFNKLCLRSKGRDDVLEWNTVWDRIYTLKLFNIIVDRSVYLPHLRDLVLDDPLSALHHMKCPELTSLGVLRCS